MRANSGYPLVNRSTANDDNNDNHDNDNNDQRRRAKYFFCQKIKKSRSSEPSFSIRCGDFIDLWRFHKPSSDVDEKSARPSARPHDGYARPVGGSAEVSRDNT